VEREEADERLERVAVGELGEGGREVEAPGPGDRDDLALIVGRPDGIAVARR